VSSSSLGLGRPGEEVVLRTRAHAAALARPIALGVVAVALLAAVVASLDGVQHVGAGGALVALVSGAAAVVAVIRLVRRVWDWERTLIEVTSREVVIERRGLARRLSVIPLASIERLAVRQGALGRLLGYGTVEVSTRGTGRRLRYVPFPRDVCAAIAARAGHNVPPEPGS
jgi:membrane protein YdbS with pleckstrin-like domain